MMKNTLMITLMLIGCLCTIGASGQPKTKFRPDKTVFLYQESPVEISDPVQGAETEALGLEMIESNGLKGAESIPENGNIGNISDNARFDLYFPKKPNGLMVVVCPGGGYSIVSSYNEGVYTAEWLVSKGYTVAIVKYRLPGGHWEVPLEDVMNVFRYCRENAGNWGVSKIGVMGFSAGGHLAASATTLYTDKITRPDFSVLIYPVIAVDDTPSHKGTRVQLLGDKSKWESTEGKSAEKWIEDQKTYDNLLKKYTLANNVTPDTPPVFLVHCADDTVVPVCNSIIFFDRLNRNGVESELHIFPSGGHGWGFSSEKYREKDSFKYARTEFETSLDRWLKAQCGK